MRPFINPHSSQAFSNDQTAGFQIDFWDTTTTVPETGIAIGLFDILDPTFDLLNSSFGTHSNLETLLNNDDVTTQRVRSILGYDTGVARMGLEPNLIKYWGTGAPPGCALSRRVFLKYKGTVRCTDAGSHPVSLVFGGNGKIRVFKNGTAIGSGVVREPLVDATLISSTTIQREGGYLLVETNVTAGDVIEVYYANNGESWGGVVGKVIPGTGWANDWITFRTKLREAGVISASFLAAAVADQISLPYCSEALLQVNEGQMPVLELQVALAPDTEPNGFKLEHIGGQNRLVDNADNTLIVRAARRIAMSGGFKRPDGTLEFYPRFLGQITSITPNNGGESATITCHGFETRLEIAQNENYPDRISYIGHGFIDWEWKGFPVYPIMAWDAWPLEMSVAEMCYRAGIDSSNLGKSAFETAPNYGKYAYYEENPDPLPTISLSGLLTGSTPSATATVTSTVSVKMAYSLVGYPTAADVRATTADTTPPFDRTFPDLTTGQTLYVSAFAYDLSGRESLIAQTTIIGPTVATRDDIPITWMDSFKMSDFVMSDRAWASINVGIGLDDGFAVLYADAEYEIDFYGIDSNIIPDRGLCVRFDLQNKLAGAAQDFPLVIALGSGGGVLSFWITPSYQVRVRRTDNAGDVTLFTSTATVPASGEFHLEIHVTINTTAGKVIVRLDETPIISLTSTNTRSDFGDDTVEMWSIGPGGYWPSTGHDATVSGIRFKDVVVLDTTGLTPTDYMGAVFVDVVLPNSDSQRQSVGMNGDDTAAYKNIATRRAKSHRQWNVFTSGQKDMYGLATIPSSVTSIIAVAPYIYQFSVGSGSNSSRFVLTSNGTTVTNTLSTSGNGFGTSYVWNNGNSGQIVYQQDPHTSAQWTRTNLNAATIGYEKVSGTRPMLVSMLGLEFVYRGTYTTPSEPIPANPPILFADGLDLGVGRDFSDTYNIADYGLTGPLTVNSSEINVPPYILLDTSNIGETRDIGLSLMIDMNSVTLTERFPIFQLRDFSGGGEQWVMGIDTTNHVYLSKNGTVQTTSSGTVDSSGTITLQFRFKYGIFDGGYQVRKIVSGTSTNLLDTWGINTTRNGNPFERPRYVHLMLRSATSTNGAGITYDDFVISNMEDFSHSYAIGQLRVSTIGIGGDGSLSQSTPHNDGAHGSNTTRYLNVQTDPGETGYNPYNSFTAGQTDFYTLASSAPTNVLAVQPFWGAGTEGATMGVASILLKSGSSTISSALLPTPGATNGHKATNTQVCPRISYELDPATMAAWSSSAPTVQIGWKQLTSGLTSDLSFFGVRFIYTV